MRRSGVACRRLAWWSRPRRRSQQVVRCPRDHPLRAIGLSLAIVGVNTLAARVATAMFLLTQRRHGLTLSGPVPRLHALAPQPFAFSPACRIHEHRGLRHKTDLTRFGHLVPVRSSADWRRFVNSVSGDSTLTGSRPTPAADFVALTAYSTRRSEADCYETADNPSLACGGTRVVGGCGLYLDHQLVHLPAPTR